jgi:CRISPR-associated endonuclease/helicase Cas3
VCFAQQTSIPPECDRDLTLHLIGTHHGHGRPLAPFWRDAETIEVEIDGQHCVLSDAYQLGRFDSGWVDQFWRLNRSYGWWGLAFLEALLRRADCMVSREEQEKEAAKEQEEEAEQEESKND